MGRYKSLANTIRTEVLSTKEAPVMVREETVDALGVSDDDILVIEDEEVILDEASSAKGQLYVVIGTQDNLSQDRVGGNFSTHPTETEIALFSSEKAAKVWIKKSTLSKPKKMFGGEELPFKNRTLLTFYNSAHVETYQKPLPLPLDPR